MAAAFYKVRAYPLFYSVSISSQSALLSLVRSKGFLCACIPHILLQKKRIDKGCFIFAKPVVSFKDLWSFREALFSCVLRIILLLIGEDCFKFVKTLQMLENGIPENLITARGKLDLNVSHTHIDNFESYCCFSLLKHKIRAAHHTKLHK